MLSLQAKICNQYQHSNPTMAIRGTDSWEGFFVGTFYDDVK